jgi:molybdopterin synthase sulfur carrier subunit
LGGRPPTLAKALAMARERHGAALAKVLERCSYVVDADPVGTRDHGAIELSADGTVEVLPPFAGG